MLTSQIHLAIRFSDVMYRVGDVVSYHNEVVNQYGAVWFGKFGGPISLPRIEYINKQIFQNIPTFIYLFKRNRKTISLYKASIFLVSKVFPKEDKILIPSYYTEKNLLKVMKVWVKIGRIELAELADLNKWKALSSKSTLDKTLALSSSGYFLIHKT